MQDSRKITEIVIVESSLHENKINLENGGLHKYETRNRYKLTISIQVSISPYRALKLDISWLRGIFENDKSQYIFMYLLRKLVRNWYVDILWDELENEIRYDIKILMPRQL